MCRWSRADCPRWQGQRAAIVAGLRWTLSAAVDVISFAHGRHDGDADASRLYLSWEKGLVDQLSAEERAQFRLTA